MRIGVVGYGTGGRHFHTPFIAAARNCELAGIVARAPNTINDAQADWPKTPIYPSLAAMIAAGVCDAVPSRPLHKHVGSWYWKQLQQACM